MAVTLRHVLHALAVCFIGSPALSDEGSVIFPDRAGASITMQMQDAMTRPDAQSVLQVFVGPSDMCCDGKSPIAGQYSLEDQNLTFTPAFDFIEGQIYTVRSDDGDLRLREFTIKSSEESDLLEVVSIYPSGDQIPENTLRFYIHFSKPMAPHLAADFIRLVDANGTPDIAAFMSFTQELWNADRTRLTLLMDPGRIKRGVAQNRKLGPAFQLGNRYSIVIEDGWPSANGGQTAPRFEKLFTVSPALRHLPDPDQWAIKSPKALSLEPLEITFDRPFDHQLAQSMLSVRDANGHSVSGSISIEDQERTWRFLPDEPWASSTIQLIIDSRLEDVAGNNFIDLLDHAVGTEAPSTSHKVRILDLRPSR